MIVIEKYGCYKVPYDEEIRIPKILECVQENYDPVLRKLLIILGNFKI